MAHFSDCGAHCSDPYCRQKDLLPMKCDGCAKVFCSAHFKYEEHNCPKGLASRDKRVIVCPLCSQAVPLPAGEDENAVWEAHAASGHCRPPQAAPAAKPRCPVPGCKEKLTMLNTFDCKRCRKTVCMKHRFEDTHQCQEAARGCREESRGGPAGLVQQAWGQAQQLVK
mmetsp:Transcript_41351/g.103868  ORF Transcript_41351/g.103868 Transcript_41351/m.103868 type:complete len:168 (+) Transcript_41351:68-571(+)